MNSKKLLSAAMAGAISMSLAVPAFAAASTTTITGTYAAPVIDVTVPKSAAAVINPYKLDYKFNLDAEGKVVKPGSDGQLPDGTTTITVKNSAIATQPMLLINYGDTKLDVKAVATGTVKTGSDMKFSAEAKEDDTVKNVKVTVDAMEATGLGAKWTEEAGISLEDTATAWKDLWADGATILSSKAIGDKTTTADPVIATLAAATVDEDSGARTLTDASIAAVRLGGIVAKNPKAEWTTKDGFTVSIAWTFEVNTDAD